MGYGVTPSFTTARISQLLILTALLCPLKHGLAQNQISNIIILGDIKDDSTWMGHDSRNILKSMRLVYNTSTVLQEVDRFECFEGWPNLQEIITCSSHMLQSADNQFIAFIPIYKPFTRQDSMNMERLLRTKHDIVDKQHISHIKVAMVYSLGEKAAANWKQHVTYFSPKDAEQKFNADTAIFVPIRVNAANYYRGKYNNLEALYLQKKGRGFVNFFCFYTDNAKKHLPLYRRAVEEIFRYED